MPESKNTSAGLRGRHCEELVKSEFLGRGFDLVSQNKKYFGTETDLLFLWEEEFYSLLEVKSLSNLDQIPFRISFQQKTRLERASHLLESYLNKPVEVLVLFVLLDDSLIQLSLADFS